MIQRQAITSTSDPRFQFCWELYVSAFPAEERRSLDYHTQTMLCERFHCDIVVDNDEPIGILFWWDLDKFTFVEHLATSSAVRGRGYGERILNALISESSKPILLEVEHPTDALSVRRIGFYKRAGFVLNYHPYRHPSYQQIKNKFVELMVMTYPTEIRKSELQEFIDNEFPVIHFKSY